MRKSAKIMTGLGVVASFGVALAPLGVFASESYEMGTDNIEVTITASCNMQTDGYDEDQGTTFTHNYSSMLSQGNYVDLGGSQGGGTATTITVICNDPDAEVGEADHGKHGYQITATPTALTGETSNDVIPMADPVDDGSASGWGAMYSKSGSGDMAIADGFDEGYKAFTAANSAETIASGFVTAGAGDTLTIDGYRVSADDSQTADTYSASVTYTFIRPID